MGYLYTVIVYTVYELYIMGYICIVCPGDVGLSPLNGFLCVNRKSSQNKGPNDILRCKVIFVCNILKYL